MPLTNFGTVTFSKIAAIGNAHPGTLTDGAWTSTAIELISTGSIDRFFGLGDPLGDGVGALPGRREHRRAHVLRRWQRNLTPG